MTYRMSDFLSMDPSQVQRLSEAGIENSDDMVRVWADEPNRVALAKKTGIPIYQFTSLASMTRLARVKNVGPKYVGLLLAAGIEDPRSLFEYTPASLVKRLGEVASQQKLTSPVPTVEEVRPWFPDLISAVVVAK
jgi:hypothetical protein